MEIWFRSWIWLAYKLALVFTVLLPLVIILWATISRNEAIVRLLIIYWRVASLLMITVYLMIPGWSIAYLTGFAALILIPISLWFWVDLNDEIDDLSPRPLKIVTTAWRWAVTGYCGLTTLVMLPFLSCGLSATTLKKPFCQVWLEAPYLYQQWFHGKSSLGFLGFLGAVGLCIYMVYFIYFLGIRLAKQGRTAMEQ